MKPIVSPILNLSEISNSMQPYFDEIEFYLSLPENMLGESRVRRDATQVNYNIY